jgi:hypothetical protein
VLHFTWLERFAREKYSSLLGPFLSYEENKTLLICPLALGANAIKNFMAIIVAVK